MHKNIFLGVDAGGTFTDFIAVEREPQLSVRIHKTLSTPAAPEEAILAGIVALGLDDLPEGDTLHVIHGSTVATNAVLEGRLARTVFVTCHGLGDLLTLARQTRPELYALHFAERPAPVPAELCLETGGRLGADGETVEPLTDADLNTLVARLTELAPEAVAINLLFSFLDDRHEKAIAAAIAAADLPLFVSRSSAVLPVYREYERGIATWLNAALGPVVHGYLSRLRQRLGNRSLQIMQSSGETLAADAAAESAVNLLLSGPAGGLRAMRFIGDEIANEHIISFDMGGTSTDVALIAGDIQTTTEGRIGSYPVAVPMVDMHTIGAGGGSIAFVDSGGMLQVGPRSAGADPGPVCYGRGGREPTVTDANLVLGRLVSTARLAGDLSLALEPARAAVGSLARCIGLGLEETALGIVQIANEHMAEAIRMISVNRGHDPAEFLLASFGGAGGLHVCAIAEAMQMRHALVPVYGGVLSALGMLVADRGRQHTRTVNMALAAAATTEIQAAFAELVAGGKAELAREGVTAAAMQVLLSADLRYTGQSYTLNVPFESVAQAGAAFAVQHEQRYGYVLPEAVEVVNLRANVFSPQQRFHLPPCAPSLRNNNEATRVYGITGAVPVFRRESLSAGQIQDGPAIISEQTATTFVAPGWRFEVDAGGNLVLKKSA